MNSCNTEKCHDYEMWLGLVLFVSGAVFLLQRFDLIPQETWFYLWPILLVVIGLKLMIAGGTSGRCEEPMQVVKSSAPAKKPVAKKKAKARK